jgi:hypothetical protein
VIENSNPRLEDIIALCRQAEAEGGTIDAATYAEHVKHLINMLSYAECRREDLEADLEHERLCATLLNEKALRHWQAWGPG